MSEDAHEISLNPANPPEWKRCTFNIQSGPGIKLDAEVISLLSQVMGGYESYLMTDERHAVAVWFFNRYKGLM